MKKIYTGPIPGRVLCDDLTNNIKDDSLKCVSYTELEKRYGYVICDKLKNYGSGDHCCVEMNLHIHIKERIIKYFSETQEYGFKVSNNILQKLKFCPWCSKSLVKFE